MATTTQPQPQIAPPQGYTPETYEAQKAQTTDWTVGGDQLVKNQVSSIVAQDSPLMQQAATGAKQQMAGRGLLNSSMAVGAGQDAVIRNAMPIAQQDAATTAQSAQFNAQAQNQAALANAGFGNDAARFGADVRNQAAAFGADSTNRFNLAQMDQAGQDFRQARDIGSRELMFQLEQAGVNNRFDQELALRAEQFNVEQYNLERRQILDNQAQLERLGLSLDANQQNIPTSFAANISNTTMMGVNSILSDGNLSADAKKGAIDNLVNYANAQISWAEKFYATAIPRISAPA